MLLASAANTLTIKCVFGYEYWENLGRVYTCSVEDLSYSQSDSERVTDVVGVHDAGHSNNDVVKLNIRDQFCEIVPKGFEKFFPKLEGLRIASSDLVSLRQSDISVFPKLRNCDIYNNKLTKLYANLFEKNPNLEYLYFGFNSIKEVGTDILKPLKQLKTANFRDNNCISKIAENRHEIDQLQERLNDDCPIHGPTEEEEVKETNESNVLTWTIVSLASIAAVFVIFCFAKNRRNRSDTNGNELAKFDNTNTQQPTAPDYDDGWDDVNIKNN